MRGHRYLIIVIIILGALLKGEIAYSEVVYTIGDLADAIYKAEGESKASHAYGILAHYKHTTPRQACINTIHSAKHRFLSQTKEKDFIHFLSLTYCPIGASNDPQGLNVNWERNVKALLRKGD
jgi:hypothetical protein